MSIAYIFPGQGSQFVGMGQKIIISSPKAKEMLEQADQILGYPLSEIMAEGPEEKLKETNFTQPAIFVHSLMVWGNHSNKASGSAFAGHSLGELSALTAAGVLSFEDGLNLVQIRANAMQKACEANPSTMAAILGMEDEQVEDICNKIEGIVVPANYNCPGQLVISGSHEAIKMAIAACQKAGAKRALEIAVGGAFHSPIMDSAKTAFKNAVEQTTFHNSSVPIYQNVDAKAHTVAADLKENLVAQLISPVRWTQSVNAMLHDGVTSFIEVGGKGKILLGMVRKISRECEIDSWIEE